MAEALEFLLRALMIGAGATIVLDLWSALLRAFGVAATNWGMVGRWIGHIPRGRLAHDDIARAAPIPGERFLGWTTHYVVGVVYAVALLAICGLQWARAPALAPALVFGIATVVAPFFVMQPAMGTGVAASKTSNPTAMRLKSLASHVVFGLGLYASAAASAALFRG
jgi:hypothetical protein